MFGIGMEFEEAEVAVEPPARHRKKRAELLKELGLELSETKTLGSGRLLQDAVALGALSILGALLASHQVTVTAPQARVP